jgi:diaminohydroxyphosphoribosylaminopyrimidine deaminase/5-amino-6-(5-phosphoribosylamino)uracil reductase
VDIQLCPDSKLRAACKELIRPFCHWSRTGLPWVVIKTAWTEDGGTPTMIPPPGQKTFTSAESLTLAHLLRRRADAILTGSGTILADWPEFTVRHLPEHQDILNKNKKRIITILDRRGRVPAKWLQEAQNRGLEVLVRPDLEEALSELGQRGVLEVLVEAGPALAAALLSKSLWNKHVLITQGKSGKPDQVRIEENVHWHHPKSRDC